MDVYQKLYNLLNEKKIETEEDKRKAIYVKKMLDDKLCFYDMDIDAIVGVLNFLEVKREDAKTIYYELISPENYKKIKTHIYSCVDPEDKGLKF